MENTTIDIYGIFGACITGFFFLAGWCWWLNSKLGDTVTFKWLEKELLPKIDRFQSHIISELGDGMGRIGNTTRLLNSIRSDLGDIKSELKVIDEALRGDKRGKYGVLHQLKDLDKRVALVEQEIKK